MINDRVARQWVKNKKSLSIFMIGLLFVFSLFFLTHSKYHKNIPCKRLNWTREQLENYLGKGSRYLNTAPDLELLDCLNCEDILHIPYGNFINKSFVEEYHNFDSFVTDNTQLERIEGHSGLKCCQRNFYYLLAKEPWIKTICETGFNAGHGTFNWLIANPNVKVYSFDLGNHDYSISIANYFYRKFPGRFELILGDSTESLPKFRKQNPHIKCDIISIDGGHTYDVAKADFINFKSMSSKRNIVVFDDWPQIWYPNDKWTPVTSGPVWEELEENGLIKEYFKCGFKSNRMRGFSIGAFKN